MTDLHRFVLNRVYIVTDAPVSVSPNLRFKGLSRTEHYSSERSLSRTSPITGIRLWHRLWRSIGIDCHSPRWRRRVLQMEQ